MAKQQNETAVMAEMARALEAITSKLTQQDKVVTGEVKHFGDALVVPESMSYDVALQVLGQARDASEQYVQRFVEIRGYHPFDVAHAFGKAIGKVCGFALGKGEDMGFFAMMLGMKAPPPKTISVEVAPGEVITAPWGRIVFPFEPSESYFEVTLQNDSNGTFNLLIGQFQGKYEKIWESVIRETRNFLMKGSIFKGRTLRVNFETMPIPTVLPWDVSSVDVSHLVFTKELEGLIEDHIFTPIRYRDLAEAAGTPFKRGVLLTGPYGTGKTLLAGAVAREAARHEMTVIYIEDVSQLPQAIRMAAQLEPAIVFAEDIDRITDGDRDHEIDTILNTLDGVDTKNAKVMTIVTSNYPDKIYKGMIRPGRLDVALNILPPDSEAAQRLVKTYLGRLFHEKNGDLEEMGNALSGLIPAVIREICERSKLSYISRTHQAPRDNSITADDVLKASASMRNQLLLLNKQPEPVPDTAQVIVKTLSELPSRINDLEKAVQAVHEYVTG